MLSRTDMPTANIRFRIVSGTDGLLACRDTWQALERSQDAHFFQTWGWYACILKNLVAAEGRVWLVLAECAERLVAVFPLQIVGRSKKGVRFQYLTLPNHSHVALRDFLVDRHYCDVDLLNGLLEFLATRQTSKFDLLQLDNISDSGAAAALIRESGHLGVRLLEIDPHREIDCRQPCAAELGHLTRKFSRNLRRLERRARDQGELRFEVYAAREIDDNIVDVFLDVEDDNWKGAIGSSIRREESLQQFYRDLVDKDRGLDCRIHMLYLGNNAIAGQFGIVSRRTCYLLKIGYRANFSDLGPGNLVMAEAIRHMALEPGIERINLLTSAPWSDKWATGASRLWSAMVFRSSVKGKISGLAIDIRDQFLRTGRRTKRQRQSR
jgi:hypothetical protein